MKKIVLCSVFIVLGLLLVTGCGNSLKEYAGTYKQVYSKFVGDPDSAKNTSDYGEITLNSDGTGTSIRDSLTIQVEWQMDGENITLKETYAGLLIEYNGTIKDNQLILYNGDKNNSLTVQKVYEKD